MYPNPYFVASMHPYLAACNAASEKSVHMSNVFMCIFFIFCLPGLPRIRSVDDQITTGFVIEIFRTLIYSDTHRDDSENFYDLVHLLKLLQELILFRPVFIQPE